jgi:rod shape-determining protein MreD
MKAKQVEPVHGLAPKLAPALVTVVLAIVSVVPVGIPGYAEVTPDLVLMSVYHWTIYRPEHMPYAAVFLIGLLVDLLVTAPGGIIGLTPLLLLIVRWTVLGQRRFFVGRSFALVWWGFALVVAAVDLLTWLAGSALSGGILEPRSLAFRAVLTVAGFPVLTLLFARIQRVTAAGA